MIFQIGLLTKRFEERDWGGDHDEVRFDYGVVVNVYYIVGLEKGKLTVLLGIIGRTCIVAVPLYNNSGHLEDYYLTQVTSFANAICCTF